jgi:2-dehydro-3-deoxygluconokinase
MKNIYFLGECMMELKSSDESTMNQSFAGDVYNSAVYLKRCFPDTAVSFVTAVGSDQISQRLVNRCESESLNTDAIFRHPSKTLGLYLIETDETGERSFTYWRSDSAAREIVDFLDDSVIARFSADDMLFISGISLAVIQPSHRDTFWQIMAKLKALGVTLVFDPNYRPRLWQSAEEAKAQIEKALTLCDIALPGVEDFTELYDLHSAADVIAFCTPFEVPEIIVKNGAASVVSYCDNKTVDHTIIPVTHVVDTTSAGDAFNGVYLGARLNEQSVTDAIGLAAQAAGVVIQQPGAIAPADVFKKALSDIGFNVN